MSPLRAAVHNAISFNNNIACSMFLAEPHVFLYGFDHDHHGASLEDQTVAGLLRGTVQVDVAKAVNIRAIELRLQPCVRIPHDTTPPKQNHFEGERLKPQAVTFFNADRHDWQTEYGNQCTHDLNPPSASFDKAGLGNVDETGRCMTLSTSKRLQCTGKVRAEDNFGLHSLQNEQGYGPTKRHHIGYDTSRTKGFKKFHPGTYKYSFELPIEHNQIESIKLQYASVRWELQAIVRRAGIFSPNLLCAREVSFIRMPDQLSLQPTEPIFINRQWQGQLHYEILISGKSFAIGSKMPIAIKLTPSGKVQVHKLEVYITESVQYWPKDRCDTRKPTARKIPLCEKVAGTPLNPAWASSEVTTIHGGEPSVAERSVARNIAQPAAGIGTSRAPEPLLEPTGRPLEDLDLGLASLWGPTEIEANIQIPTCEMIARNNDLKLHPDCTWKNVGVYHWVEVVLRLNRLDNGAFEEGTRNLKVNAHAPVAILDCRASGSNANLPAYSGSTSHQICYPPTCGCPDAPSSSLDTPLASATNAPVDFSARNGVLLGTTGNAHLFNSGTINNREAASGQPSVGGLGCSGGPRPLHYLRPPSFSPPPFDGDVVPPRAVEADVERAISEPVVSPPPQYDAVIGTPSLDGLADYFERRARFS